MYAAMLPLSLSGLSPFLPSEIDAAEIELV
jgi:hypothetical protein